MSGMEWRGRTVRLVPLGEGAVTLRVGELEDPEVNGRVRRYADAVEAAGFPGIVEAVAGYHTVTVYYDPVQLYRGLDRIAGAGECGSLQEAVCQLLRGLWEQLEDGTAAEDRTVEIPVSYGGADGPDLEGAAAWCGLKEEQYVRLHSSVLYRVYMIGFVPGFPYLGGLPPELAVPRLDTPRIRVPAGSVAVGGGHTGIYPVGVPGGWRLIGRTETPLFDPDRPEPCLLRAGDRVRFVPVEKPEHD
ncbi:5-oxoprolinase subunit PxpB [Gorillibacterium sp. sgz5001074]|uniref:5-oxoprolinase subunit PxpB n=1 Tax=Gorillibacterium sp. sgz5001074 TaxID=3446695 RepID=UPI003F6639F9